MLLTRLIPIFQEVENIEFMNQLFWNSYSDKFNVTQVQINSERRKIIIHH